jgi:hypothetical protein
VLNSIRKGESKSQNLQLLDECLVNKKPLPNDGIIPTKLYCINRDVDRENLQKLNEIPEEAVCISATDVWKVPVPHWQNYTEKIMMDAADKTAPPELILKRGAQVVLLRNRFNDMNKYNRLMMKEMNMMELSSEGGGSSSSSVSDGSDGGGGALGSNERRLLPPSAGSAAARKPLVNGSRGIVVGYVRSVQGEGDELIPKVRFDDGQVVAIGKYESNKIILSFHHE